MGADGKALSAWRKEQGQKDSRQWAVGSKSRTTDYRTIDNQGKTTAKSEGQSRISPGIKITQPGA